MKRGAGDGALVAGVGAGDGVGAARPPGLTSSSTLSLRAAMMPPPPAAKPANAAEREASASCSRL